MTSPGSVCDLDESAWQDLVAQVRRLADEIAPHEPAAANAAFDVLVARYGRGPAAQALLAVAGDEFGPVVRQHCLDAHHVPRRRFRW